MNIFALAHHTVGSDDDGSNTVCCYYLDDMFHIGAYPYSANDIRTMFSKDSYVLTLDFLLTV